MDFKKKRRRRFGRCFLLTGSPCTALLTTTTTTPPTTHPTITTGCGAHADARAYRENPEPRFAGGGVGIRSRGLLGQVVAAANFNHHFFKCGQVDICDLGWRAFLAYTATPTVWRGRVGWTPAHLRWTWLVEFELGLHGPRLLRPSPCPLVGPLGHNGFISHVNSTGSDGLRLGAATLDHRHHHGVSTYCMGSRLTGTDDESSSRVR